MKNKIAFVTIKNPFDTTTRETDIIDFVEDKTIGAYVAASKHYDPQMDAVVVHNGALVPKEKFDVCCLRAGDCVVYAPAILGGGDDGGKNILGMIAGIALSIVSMGVGNLIAYGSWTSAAGMAGWGFGAYLGAAAAMYLGGKLLSANTTTPSIDIADYETKSKYSWSTPNALSGQGYALPIVYGSFAPTPIILGRHITTDGENEYLNLLLCLGDGPLDPETDSITDIRINDNPIENYTDVHTESRLGTNDQGAIAGFDNTYSDQSLSYELEVDGGYSVHLTDTNAAKELEVTLSFPAGLYYANDNGGLANASAKVEIQYKKHEDSVWLNSAIKTATSNNSKIINPRAKAKAVFETWTITISNETYHNLQALKIQAVGSVSGAQPEQHFTSGYFCYSNDYIEFTYHDAIPVSQTITGTISIIYASEIEISAAQNTALRRVYSWPVEEGQYEVRIRCTYKSGTTSRYSTRLYWTMLTGVIQDDFTRPGKILLAIKALATGQLSGGIPTVSCVVHRAYVWVYNSITATYEKKPANNPAWVAYDLIHRAKSLYDVRTNAYVMTVFGAPADRIIYQDFVNWAAFCDDRELTFNGVFDKTVELSTALKDTESCGRGKVLTFGTKYGAICDKPADYIYSVYNMGNIKKGTFRLDYLDIKDRANAIDVSYYDAKINYARNIVPVFSDEYNSDTVIKNPTQVTLPGVTNAKQAYKEGKYRLRLAKYPVRTVAFEVNVEAVKDRVGDVIYVQHDVPQWGYGGRILAINGNVLTLDTVVDLYPNIKYTVMVRHTNDILETREITAVASHTQTSTITVKTAFDAQPEKFDVYTFGQENLMSKPFRIVNITRSSKMDRLITALEYIEEIYTEATDIPNIAYSTLTAETEVTAVSYGQETYMQKDGTIQSVIYVSWELPRGKYADRFIVYVSSDNGANWSRFGETKAYKITITNVKALQYYKVKVVTVNDIGVVSAGFVSEQIYITGKDTPPANVTGLTATTFVVDTSKITLSWAKNTDPDIRGYVIIRTIEGVETDISQIITDNNYVYQAPNAGEVTLGVKAVDNSGNRSTTAATITHTFACISNVTGLTVKADSNNRTKVILEWPANSEKDLSYYEIRNVTGSWWGEGIVIASKLKTTYYNYQLPAAGSYIFAIKAYNLGGFESEYSYNALGTFSFNPSNVSGLTSTQSNIDKSKVRLTWDPVSDTDLDHYELRVGGTSWNNATLLQSNITATFFDTLINSESEYIFRIAAANKAGYISAEPSSLCMSFGMKPAQITGLTATTRNDDRTFVDIIWNEVTDADLLYYEIRYGGSSWDDATVLARTKEEVYHWKLSTSGTYTIRIKSKNAAGFYSSETTIDYAAVVEPSNVTGFAAIQNGEKILLVWDKCNDVDFAYYEIHEGATYEKGSVLKSGLTINMFEFLAASETTRNFHIKAFNRAGYKSITAASALIKVSNLLPKNAIAVFDEMALKSGFSGFNGGTTEFGPSDITFATLEGKFSDYTAAKFSEVGGLEVLKPIHEVEPGIFWGSYSTPIRDLNRVATVNFSTEFVSTALVSDCSCELSCFTSIDGFHYSFVRPSVPFTVTCRYFFFVVDLYNYDYDPETHHFDKKLYAEVNVFKITIDGPDIIQSGTATATESGNPCVLFPRCFFAIPTVIVTATEAGKYAVLGVAGTNSFSVHVYNTAGVEVGGTVNWIAKGF